jgi:hypothetical protein
LNAITVPDWLEWLEWINIRGPIGGPREDYYTAFIAQQSAGPFRKADDGKFENFIMPWLRPDEVDVLAFVRNWIDTRGTSEE